MVLTITCVTIIKHCQSVNYALCLKRGSAKIFEIMNDQIAILTAELIALFV